MDYYPPPVTGGWVNADFVGGWTCHVEQGHYGHPSLKATWLYAIGVDIPVLPWGDSPAGEYQSGSKHDHLRDARRKPVELLSRAERIVTPAAFRDLLIAMARSAR